MIRNLKALGLALVALLVLSAVAASSASAQTLGKLTTAGNVDVTLKGKENAGGLNAWTGPGTVIKCPGSTYTAHGTLTQAQTAEGKKHVLLKPNETSFTITPHYVNCESGGIPRTVDMNGCDYDFRDFTTAPLATTPNTYKFDVDIVCPTGKQIEKTGGACTIKYPAQTGKTGLHLTQTTAPADPKELIHVKGTLLGTTGTACGIGFTAELHLDLTFEAVNAVGGVVVATITH